MSIRHRTRGRSDGPGRGVPIPMSARPGFQREGRDLRERGDARVEHLRVPPQSIEAEQAVLGGLMLSPDAYDRVGD